MAHYLYIMFEQAQWGTCTFSRAIKRLLSHFVSFSEPEMLLVPCQMAGELCAAFVQDETSCPENLDRCQTHCPH